MNNSAPFLILGWSTTITIIKSTTIFKFRLKY